MLPALIIFLLTYLLMLVLPQYRPFAALGGAALFLALGAAGLWDFTLMDAARAVDFNVLLMMAGTMGTVSLFIESRMPARLAELLIVRVPNVKWAVCMLALFAGVISAFVDNVATVLMVAPVGLAIARKLRISPVPVLISIAVSSNLQGAATLVGDTTSILLGGFAGMNFFHFFWMEGRPGIFFGVELGGAGLSGRAAVHLPARDPAHLGHGGDRGHRHGSLRPDAADGGSAHRGLLPAPACGRSAAGALWPAQRSDLCRGLPVRHPARLPAPPLVHAVPAGGPGAGL